MDDLKMLMDELDAFPKRIHEAEVRSEELRESWQTERTKREYEFNRAFLTHKAAGGSEAQAKAKACDEVHNRDMLIVMAESAYRKALADYHYLENRFNALRKMANLQEAALHKIGTTV